LATGNYIERLKRLSDIVPAAANAAPVTSTRKRDSLPATRARSQKNES
jgi:hypothetical protein